MIIKADLEQYHADGYLVLRQQIAPTSIAAVLGALRDHARDDANTFEEEASGGSQGGIGGMLSPAPAGNYKGEYARYLADELVPLVDRLVGGAGRHSAP